MRGLRYAAIAAVSLLIVMLLLVGYLFMTAEVQVVGISAQGIPVANDPAGFETLKKAIEENTFIGTLYQKPLEWQDASEYVYLEYTLRIRNNCLVPIDMIEVQVIPQSSDVLQTIDLGVRSLDLKSEGDLKVRVLAPKDTHPIREMIVTYYVWGVSFSLRATYGG